MSGTTRKALLVAALALTLVASFWPESRDEVVQPTGRTVRPQVAPVRMASLAGSTPAAGAVSKMEGEGADGEIVDLFPSQSWAPPVAVAPPPPPPPPPFPYQFAGRYEEEGKTVVFMKDEANVWALKEGAPLPGGWTLVRIEPASLRFSLSGQNISRTISIGELKP